MTEQRLAPTPAPEGDPFADAADRLKHLREVATGHTGGFVRPPATSELGEVDGSRQVNAGLIENLRRAEASTQAMAAQKSPDEQPK